MENIISYICVECEEFVHSGCPMFEGELCEDCFYEKWDEEK